MKTIGRNSFAKRVLAYVMLVLMVFNVVGDTAAAASTSFRASTQVSPVYAGSRLNAPLRAEAAATAVPVPAVTVVPEQTAPAAAEAAAQTAAVPAEGTAAPAEETAVPAETAAAAEPTAVPAEVTAVPAETTAVPAEATAAPTAAPDTRTALHRAIAARGYAYVYTNQGNLAVYGGPSLILNTHKGHLVYGGVLVYAIGYTAREGQEAAVAIRFATRDGLVEGYVAESQLSQDVQTPEQIRAKLAGEIAAGEIEYWMDGEKTARPLPFVAYKAKETPAETQEEEGGETQPDQADAAAETPAADVDAAETEAPAETESPAATEAAENTEAPSDTESPADTASPDVTGNPEETAAPEATAQPEETALPAEDVATASDLYVDPAYAWTLTDAATGVAVTLTGAALLPGMLPENVQLTVRALSEEEAAVYIAQLTPAEQELFVAYDITLIDGLTGLPFQPAEPVQVTLPLPPAAETLEDPTLTVYHAQEDSLDTVLHSDEVDGEHTVFDADHFSVYLLRMTPRNAGANIGQKVVAKASVVVAPADAAFEASVRPATLTYQMTLNGSNYTGLSLQKAANYELTTSYFVLDQYGNPQNYGMYASRVPSMYTESTVYQNGQLLSTLTFQRTTSYKINITFIDQDNEFNLRPTTLLAANQKLTVPGEAGARAADSVVKNPDGTFTITWNNLPTTWNNGGTVTPIYYQDQSFLSNDVNANQSYPSSNVTVLSPQESTRTYYMSLANFQVDHYTAAAHVQSTYNSAFQWSLAKEAGVNAPASYTYTLMDGNAPANIPNHTVTFQRNADLTYPVLNHVWRLPARTATGQLIDYSNYTVKITPSMADGTLDKQLYSTATVVNTNPSGKRYTVNTVSPVAYAGQLNVTWNDNNNALGYRPTGVTATFLANGQPIPGLSPLYVGSANGNVNLGSWNYNTYLPQKDDNGDYIRYTLKFDGLPGAYTATEVEVNPFDPAKGYSTGTSHQNNVPLNRNITFSLNNTRKIRANKVWDANGSGNEILSRPTSINVKIMSSHDNGVTWQELEGRANQPIVPSNNVWSAEWDVPVTDAQGRPLIYKLEETPLGVYTTTYNQTANGTNPQVFTITNTFQPNWDYSLAMYWDEADPAKRIFQETETVDYQNITRKANLAISTNKDYPAGSMEVRVPYVLHKQRPGTTYPVPNVALPLAPATNPNYSFNYTIDKKGSTNPEDWELVFTNWQDVAAGYKLSTMISWTVNPMYVLDNDVGDLKATGSATAQGEAAPTQRVSNDITHVLDTGVSAGGFFVTKQTPQYGSATSTFNGGRLYGWDTNYGPKPANFDPTQYNYVVYALNPSYFSYNQPFRVQVKETPGQNGQVVSVYSRYGMNFTYDATKQAWVSVQYPTYASASGGNLSTSDFVYVVVAHPRSESLDPITGQVKDGVVYTNDAEMSILPADVHPGDKTLSDAYDELKGSDRHSYPWQDFVYNYTGSIYDLSKYMWSGNNAHLTRLDLGVDPRDTFSLSATVNGYAYQDGYRVELFDDQVYLNAYNQPLGRYYGYERMDQNDYEIDVAVNHVNFTLSVSNQGYDMTTGQTGPGEAQSGSWKIMGRKGNTGAWEEIYASAPMTAAGQSYAIPASVISGKGYTAIKVVSPDGLRNRNTISLSGLAIRYKHTSTRMEPYWSNPDVTYLYTYNYGGMKLYVNDGTGNYTWTNSLTTHNYTNGNQQNVTASDMATEGAVVDRRIASNALQRVSFTTSPYKGVESISYDVNNSKVDAVFVLAGREIMNTGEMEDQIYANWAAESGVLYDLLPKGYSYDPSKGVRVHGTTYSNGSIVTGKTAALERVETINDYKGTGRQMVKFYIKSTQAPGQNYWKNGTTQAYTGFYVRFTATSSYSDIGLFGNTSTNLMAYQRTDGKPITHGVADDGTGGNSSVFTSVTAADGTPAMKDLNEDGNTTAKDTLVASVTVNATPITSVQSGIKKSVKAMSSYFRVDDVSDLGKEYTYRLMVETGDNGTTKGLVITDILEVANGANGWKGTLKDVNVSAARIAGIDAKVYYSTATNLSYTNASQMALTASHWTQTKPANAAQITAIAVDLSRKLDGSEMVFTNANSIYTDVTFTAPSVLQAHEKSYNQPAYWSTFQPTGSAVPTTAYTVGPVSTVALHDLQDFTFIKQMPGDAEGVSLPASGVEFKIYRSSTSPATGIPGNSSSSYGATPVYEVTSGANGAVTIQNLDSGIYAIVESRVPDGMTILNGRYWTFVVDGAAGTTSDPQAQVYSASYTLHPMVKKTVGAQEMWTLTNVRATKSFTVYKDWVSSSSPLRRPVTFELYRNDVKVDSKELAVGQSYVTFTNMLTYDQNGTPFRYVVKEVPVPGFTADTLEHTITTNTSFRFRNVQQGAVEIRKTLQDSDAAAADFPITVTVGGTAALDSTLTLYRYDTFDATTFATETVTPTADRKVNFTIKGGQKVQLIGLPLGVSVTTTENAANYTTTVIQGSATSTTSSSAVNLVHFRNVPKPASFQLPVRKLVNGPSRPANDLKTFTFRIAAVTSGAPIPSPVTVTIQDAGTAQFPAMTFTRAGEFTYTVREDAANYPGYTLDTNTYTVAVTVKDVNGELVPTFKVNNADATQVTFTNTYSATPVSLTLPVRKVITGGTPGTAQTFNFTITPVGAAPAPATATASVTGAGTANFGSITFTQMGTYEYDVKETAGTHAQYQYDSATKRVRVVVTNVNGALQAAWTVDGVTDTAVPFTNRYTPTPVSVTIPVRKAIAGNATPADKTFTFTLTRAGTEPMPAANTVTVTGAGTASFGAITYTAPGTYTYTLRETQGTEPGYTYDTAARTLTVNVTSNGDALVAAWQVNGQTQNPVLFTNTYDPADAKVILPVRKTITGNARPANKNFTFTLARVTAGAPMPASPTVTISDAGTANFGEISFSTAGVYEYTLKETQGTEPGYTYDTATHAIKVTVTDNNGTLTAVWTDNNSTVSEVNFINRYVPAPVSVAIPVRKAITGNNRPAQKETFTFRLVPVGGAPALTNNTVTIQDTGNASFEAVQFTAAGEYTYTLTEVGGNAPGYTYDTTPRTVKVTVTDNNGTLSAAWTVNNQTQTPVVFTNQYVPAAASLTLPLRKNVTGNPRPAAGQQTFTFTLTAAPGVPMPAQATATITDSGNASLGAIAYTSAGTYTYTLRETAGNAHGYTYDTTPRTITVNVTDTAGVLSASYLVDGQSASTINFTNTYNPDDATLELPVRKNITGNPRPAQKETFTFTLAAVTAGAPMPSPATVTITDAGTARLPAMTFPAAGVYEYTLKETQGSAAGYTYDAATHNIRVTVTDTNGVLTAAWTDNGNTVADAVFTNRYAPSTASVTLPVRKVITGTPRPAQKETFSFTLAAVTAGAPMPAQATVTVSDAGTVSFPAMTFATAGVYEYTLKETQGNRPGYTYDTATHAIRVTVTDTNGSLSAVWTDNNATVANVTFTNQYDPADATLALPVRKNITGNPRPAAERETFTFTLAAVGGAPMPASPSVTITDAGTASFGNITFPAAGVYNYTLTETQGTKPGYTYDPASHAIQVTVTDVNGVLTAAWTDNTATATEVVFTNSYDPADATLAIPVRKVITGHATPSSKTFTFTVAGSAGAPMPASATTTVTGAADGAFGAITFTRAGTYTYTVRETQGNEPGYTYDAAAHTVVATVTDTAGVLSVTWSDNGQPGSKVTFTNNYDPADTTVVIPVRKLITGNPRPAQKETFSFKLTAVGTAPMPATATVTVEDTGNVSFPAITFDTAGVYEYTLAETQGTAGGYTYDAAPRAVRVTVTDTNGALGAVWTVNGAAESPVKFTNHYDPSDISLVLPVRKVITGNDRPAQKETFTFTLAAVGTAPMPAASTVTITDAGTASFPAISFPSAGVYEYTIRETQGTKPGYTYDNTVHTIRATVTDTAGVLSVAWTDNGTPGTQVAFTNQYDPADVTLAFPVKKVITGNPRPTQKETFTFTLTADAGTPLPSPATVSIEDAGTAAFPNITFTKAGVYTYTLKETQGNAQGYTYDPTEHTLKATVTDVNGALQVVWTDNNATVTDVTFTNTYLPGAVTVALPVRKTITGNPRPAQKETFTFTLAAVGGAPVPANTTITVTDAGTATFQAISFTAAGVYNYTVRETPGTAAGYTYDPAVHNIRITVTDTAGVLSATWTDGGVPGTQIGFTNDYTPAPATLALPVTKAITGNDRPAAKETFSFKLVPQAGAPMPAADTITIVDAGNAAFGSITFPAAGVYTYTLTEIQGTKPGYTYDSASHTIQVTVTDEGGTLSATWTDNSATAASVRFTNQYDPADVTVSIPVRKAITGNPRPAAKETFAFTMTPEGGAPAPATGNVTIEDAGTASFGAITFDKAGEYTYTVRETAGAAPGYTYDNTAHTVKVTVTDVNGVLRAVWTDNNATVANVLFTNNYTPAPTAVTFPVRKNITGNARPANKTFTFTLAGVTAGAPMPASATVTISDAGTASFPAIQFTAAGVYEYTLTETAGLEPGYTYDPTPHTLRVTVTDTAGVLSAVWTDNGQTGSQVTFTNRYDPADATVTIPVQKLITGNNRPAQKETFRFVLSPLAGAPAPASTVVTIEDVGTASFPAITFTEAGEYTYTLAETQGTAGGYTYDAAPRTVKVTVTDTNGTLGAVWTVNNVTENPVKFTNHYAPGVAGIDVPIRKAITGNARPAQKETFTFTLAAVGGAPLPAEVTKTIEDEGTASFGRFTFNTAGVYEYTITETQGTAAGYTYDTAVRNIRITVTDTAGVLSASFTSNGATVPSVVFTNRYDPADATLTLPVRKIVTGNDRPAQKETFSFTLTADPGVPMPANATVTVTDAGTVSFPAITYTAAGVYDYTLRETQGTKPGYTYDTASHAIRVTVTDTAGVLSAVWTDNGSTAADVAFTNSYIPAPTSLSFPVEKVITGNPRPAGEQETFTFTLAALAGAPMPASDTVTISDAGTATFGAISFTAAGTYRYTVKETRGAKPGYTYDNTTRSVVATVTDVNGALQAAWTVDTVAGANAVFTNNYTPAPATLALPVTKQITGNDRPADKETFTFRLVPQSGAPMPAADQVTITDAGNAAFGSITFPAAGVYTYTLREVAGTKPGYTYDPAPRTIQVTVTDTAGVLSAAWTSDNAAATSVVFTNHYDPTDATLSLPVTKVITGNPRPTANQETFTFTLEAQGGAPMPASATVTVTDAGSVSFPAITFSRAGTFTYTLRETQGNKPGYTYDTAAHTIAVTVTDTNGVLSAAWQDNGNPGTSVTFTNHYDPVNAAVVFPVKKVITGNDRPAHKTFTFTLAGLGGAPMPAANTVTISDAGEASFGSITYPAAGVYNYTLTETDDGEPGYTYDAAVHALQVTVADVNGVLTAAWTDDGQPGDKVTFTNNYTPSPVSLNLPVTKLITGKPRPAGQEETFSFTIAPQNGAPAPAGSATVTITDQGNAAFPAIQFTRAGTYTYLVSETVGNKPGYTYDALTRTVTVTVVDVNGALSQTWTVNMGVPHTVAFVNGYDPAKAQVVLPVRKHITGNDRPAQKQTFSFVLAAVTAGAPMPATTSVTITDAGTASFPAMSYDTAGTYEYTLTETAGTAQGYTYDSAVHHIRVVVTDVNGVLTPVWTDNGASVAEVAFTNDYTPTPATLALPAQKVIRYVTPTSVSNFTFTIAGEAGAPMPANNALTVAGASAGQFDPITFTRAGTYRYTVQETPQTLTGYTFDTHLYQVVATVTDQGGTLAVTWTVDGQTATHVTITNDYKPLPVSLQLPVTKVLTGQTPPSAAAFTFQLSPATSGAPMPASAETTITGAGSSLFQAIRFTQSGTYTYLVTEVNSGIPGYTYDGTQYFATVTVTDVNGQLQTALTMSTASLPSVPAMTFTNDYRPAPVALEIPMRNNVYGHERPRPYETFHFTFVPADPSNPMPPQNGNSVVDNGTFQYGRMEFSTPGVYTYTMTETIGSAPGYTYDTVPHTVVVTVWDDNGVLRVRWTDNGQPGTEVNFHNYYQPNPVSLQIPVTKAIAGNPRPSLKPFTFMITGLNGAPMPANNTVTVTDAGNGLLDAITFTRAGNYTYEVTEIQGTEHGYAYDAARHVIQVAVVDVAAQLQATWTDNGAIGTSVTFTNVYAPDAATLALPVRKTISGGHDIPTAKTFTFTLTGLAGAPMPVGTAGNEATLSIVGSGQSAFPLMVYREAGTFQYTLKEVQGSERGYTYATNVYHLTVDVTDANGTLTAVWRENGGARELVFDNPYQPLPTAAVIPVLKGIWGTVPAGRETDFHFDLVPQGGAPAPAAGLDSVTIRGEGRAYFGELRYTRAGKYTYLVTERDGGVTGYIYDTRPRIVTMHVEDMDGQLQAYYTVEVDGKPAEDMIFVNEYKPVPASIDITGQKILRHKMLRAGQFRFNLYDELGRRVKTTLNTFSAVYTFTDVIFDRPGEFVYTIREYQGAEEGIVYDKSEFKITIRVEDVDGKLVATVDKTQGDLRFVNRFRSRVPRTGYDELLPYYPVMAGAAALLALLFLMKKKKQPAK